LPQDRASQQVSNVFNAGRVAASSFCSDVTSDIGPIVVEPYHIGNQF
jgi:hypothetical protein